MFFECCKRRKIVRSRSSSTLILAPQENISKNHYHLFRSGPRTLGPEAHQYSSLNTNRQAAKPRQFSVKRQYLRLLRAVYPENRDPLQIREYADLPTNHAGATLVAFAANTNIRPIVTFDKRNFGTYTLPKKIILSVGRLLFQPSIMVRIAKNNP